MAAFESGGRLGALGIGILTSNQAPGQTVGPHSPEPKIRHDAMPALATTIRPDLATATRWANTSGWRQAKGFSGAQTARYSSLSASSIRIVPTRSGRNR